MKHRDVNSAISYYYDDDKIKGRVSNDPEGHRKLVGGLWDEIGALQLEFLVSCGLRPEHKLVDIGCGSFRGGVHFIDYLEPTHYFGIDISPDLLEAGYVREIEPKALDTRFPRHNFHVSGDFDVSGFGTRFDFAVAQSLFTHLPLDSLRLCLKRLHGRMNPGARFFFTYFECPPWADFASSWTQEPGGRITHPGKDPFHYRMADIIALSGRRWAVDWMGDWNHPRNQKMAIFRRR